MKIGICSNSEGLKSVVADRFGRADFFVIVDLESKEVKTIENTSKNEASGAGGSAVRNLNQENVEVVLVPELGPKAMTAIKAFEIKAYGYQSGVTVEEAIEEYKLGKLKEILSNTNDGHKGLRRA